MNVSLPRIYSPGKYLSPREVSHFVLAVDDSISECLFGECIHTKKIISITGERLASYRVFTSLEEFTFSPEEVAFSHFKAKIYKGDLLFFPITSLPFLSVEEKDLREIGVCILNFSFPKKSKVFIELRNEIVIVPFEKIVRYQLNKFNYNSVRLFNFFYLKLTETNIQFSDLRKLLLSFENRDFRSIEIGNEAVSSSGVDVYNNEFIEIYGLKNSLIKLLPIIRGGEYTFDYKFFDYNQHVLRIFGVKFTFSIFTFTSSSNEKKITIERETHASSHIPIDLPNSGRWVRITIS